MILARDAADGFGEITTSLSQAMTPDQAIAPGFAMPAILAELDLALIAESSASKVANAELATAKAVLERRVAALKGANAELPGAAAAETPRTEPDYSPA